MTDAIHSVAIIVLAIGAIGQQRSLRRLRREHRALRRAHHEAQRWYGMMFDGSYRRPAPPVALASSTELRGAR